MKNFVLGGMLILTFLLIKGKNLSAQPFHEPSGLKPRVIVLTDLKRVQETDDAASLIRLLTLADLVEVEGIVVSSGFNYWKPEHVLEGYELIWEMLDAYGSSVPNMMKMNNQKTFNIVENTQKIGYWPSVNYLKQRTAIGTALLTMKYVGDNFSNDGSRLITSVVDESDPRPLYVLVWGGGNVLAQAIWDISENPLKKRTPEAVDAFVKKLRIISIEDQDTPWNDRFKPLDENNSHYWMRKKFPSMKWVMVTQGNFMKQSDLLQPFYQMHIQGHGALGNMYPDHSNNVEGDTPSLFYVLPLGMGDPEHPEWGSIAGIYAWNPHPKQLSVMVWSESVPGNEEFRKMSQDFTLRCIQPMWNLFAARLDWARSATGNRLPVAVVNGSSNGILEVNANRNSVIEVDASQSYDNEIDNLNFKWSLVPLPTTPRNVLIETPAESRTKIKIPADANGKEIHVLLELTDDGAAHPLTVFRRVIIKVR